MHDVCVSHLRWVRGPEFEEAKLIFFNPLDDPVLFSVGGAADEDGQNMVAPLL